MAKRKTAMVQPAPSRPGHLPVLSAEDLPLFANPALEANLIKALKHRKNDRAYVVLEYHTTWAAVHFEGDYEPTTINY